MGPLACTLINAAAHIVSVVSNLKMILCFDHYVFGELVYHVSVRN